MQLKPICLLLTLLIVIGSGTTGCRSRRGDVDASRASDAPTKKKRWGRERREGFQDDVFSVVCIFPTNMWKSFDSAGDQNVEGFEFILMLLSQTTGKAAWSDGRMIIDMYTSDRDAEGGLRREKVQSWTASSDDLPRRTPSMTGYSYQPSVSWWGSDLDVYGKEIEIVVQFERPDGNMLRAQTRPARVPKRLD